MKDIIKIELIPDFFYDFIAYLVPFSFPLCYVLLRYDFNFAQLDWTILTVSALGLYATGLMLPALSWPISGAIISIFKGKLAPAGHTASPVSEVVRANLRKFHEVRLKNKDLGLLLQKRYARVIAIRNMAFLWLGVAAWDIYHFHNGITLGIIVVLLLFVPVLVSTHIWFHRDIHDFHQLVTTTEPDIA